MKKMMITALTVITLITMVTLLSARGNDESAMMMDGSDAVLPPGAMNGKYEKPSDDKLRKELNDLQFQVTQEDGTERAFSNMFWDNNKEGIYVDIVSGEPLFSSTDKYKSGTGWPSFTRPLEEGNVLSIEDTTYGMVRIEVRSLFADSHLGHVFNDGPQPTGLRYCINSASLRFVPVEDLEEEGYRQYLSLFGLKSEFALDGVETAVFAGGCFWGIEGVFEMLEGVEDVVSGYSGGSAATAFYKMVGTGATGHAEAVRIVYDPQYISYETLLDVFFSVAHDPTQYNYQGPDVGTEYRSAVFYLDETQKMKTEMYIKELEKGKVYKQPIVTEVIPLDAFYPAEDYHQDFMKLNPEHPYIVYWDVPKVRDLEYQFPELIADK